MIETPTSKNIRNVLPLILVILAALFFLTSYKKPKQEGADFNQNPNTAKINFKNESGSLSLALSIRGLDCD